MIRAIEELLDWMHKNNMEEKGVELTIHCPSDVFAHQFVYTLQRELCLSPPDPKATCPRELTFFGMPLHVKVKE